MAITTNQLDDSDRDPSVNGANWSFTITKHDTNYLEDPSNAGTPVMTKAIIIDRADEAVKVEFANGRTDTFEAGTLAAGVMHPMNIVKVFSTGTGGNVVVKAIL